jgi:hypothetical protein
MLLVKFAFILMCLLMVLIPISIRLLLKKKCSFDDYRVMVKNQYPSLFHSNRVDNNS